jgi:hypothetical protein
MALAADVNEKVGKAYKIGSTKGGYNDIYPKPPKNPTIFNFTIEEANNGPVTLIGHAVAVENEFYDPSSFKFDLLINDCYFSGFFQRRIRGTSYVCVKHKRDSVHACAHWASARRTQGQRELHAKLTLKSTPPHRTTHPSLK